MNDNVRMGIAAVCYLGGLVLILITNTSGSTRLIQELRWLELLLLALPVPVVALEFDPEQEFAAKIIINSLLALGGMAGLGYLILLRDDDWLLITGSFLALVYGTVNITALVVKRLHNP